MDTFDNRCTTVPNSKVFGSVIETITFPPTRRADDSAGVAYDADLDQTRTALEEAAVRVVEEHDSAVAETAPQVVLDALADSSVNWIVRVWAKTPDFLAVKQAPTRAVKQELDATGLSIPFLQMDVHLDPPSPASHEASSNAPTGALG